MSAGPRIDISQRDWGAEDSSCSILHVDMDAFFAAVELHDNPTLRGRAVIVGGDHRAVVLSATYEARAYGVKSAMPMSQARRLCPDAIVVPPRMERYRQVSGQVMQILAGFTPLIEQVSVDEAYLDVSGAKRRWGSARHIATEIRRKIQGELGVTCSVGIGPSKLIAKLASTHIKPDGLALIPRATQIDFVQRLPIEALPGVGGKTAKLLHNRGINSVYDLAHVDAGVIRYWLGNVGSHLHDLAWARDASAVQPVRAERSLGAERTLEVDSRDADELDRIIVKLSEKVAYMLRQRGNNARTIVVKVKFADLHSVTRSRSLPTGVSQAHTILENARTLFRDACSGADQAVRLVGIRAEHLGELAWHGTQPTLEEASDSRLDKTHLVDQLQDRVKNKFGLQSLRVASGLEGGGVSRSGCDFPITG